MPRISYVDQRSSKRKKAFDVMLEGSFLYVVANIKKSYETQSDDQWKISQKINQKQY